MLDRELEALLRVEPSPSFVARTRARAAVEGVQATHGLAWSVAWTGGAAAVVVAAVSLWPAERPALPSVELPGIALASPAVAPPSVATPAAPESTLEPEPRVPARARSERALPEPVEAPVPEVVIAPEEARGFELLLAGLDRGLIDGSMLSEEWGRRDADDRVVIDIIPIDIVPLMPLARPEGERP